MLKSLFTGDYSPEERRKRYMLATCWREGALERAASIAEDLLRDTTNDAALWAAYLATKLPMLDPEKSLDVSVDEFLQRNIPGHLKLDAVSAAVDLAQTPNTSTLIVKTVLMLKTSGTPDKEMMDAYVRFVETLLGAGLMSLARDVVEHLREVAHPKDIDIRLSPLIDGIGDAVEKPLHTLTTMLSHVVGRLAPSHNAMRDSSFTSLLPYGFSAWKQLRETWSSSDYLHIGGEGRREMLESFEKHFLHFLENPSEVRLMEDLEFLYQDIIDWQVSQGYPTDAVGDSDEDEDIDDNAYSENAALPDFDDEEYLNFVDYVLDHFEQIFPDHPVEHQVFCILSLLPVYAEGYRTTDVRAALSDRNSGDEILEYMRGMLTVVEDLWQLHTTHDEVSKALSMVDIYEYASDLCGQDLAYEAIEVQLSTLHYERKTLQKLIKEAAREKRKPGPAYPSFS